jgi:hypothetical protein
MLTCDIVVHGTNINKVPLVVLVGSPKHQMWSYTFKLTKQLQFCEKLQRLITLNVKTPFVGYFSIKVPQRKQGIREAYSIMSLL